MHAESFTLNRRGMGRLAFVAPLGIGPVLEYPAQRQGVCAITGNVAGGDVTGEAGGTVSHLPGVPERVY